MDTAFQITAQDLASATFKEMQANAKASTDGVVSGFKRASQETSTFTKFIREQRTENRLQNFVFRETVQSMNGITAGMLALSNTMGSTNDDTKKLTQSVTQGFLAFQGLEFALTALGAGPWGVASAAVVGLGIGLNSLAEAARKSTKETMNQKQVFEDMIKIYNNWREILNGTSDDNKTASEAELRLVSAKIQAYEQVIDQQTRGIKQIKVIINDVGMNNAQVLEAQNVAFDASGKKLSENIAMLEALRLKYKGVTAAMNEVIVTASKSDFFSALQPADFPKLQLSHGLPDVGGVLGLPQGADHTISEWDRVAAGVAHNLETIGATTDNVANLITNTMGNAASMMTDAFFGASVSIGQIFEGLFRDLVRMAFETFLKMGFLNLVSGGLGSALGGGGIPLVGPPAPSAPISPGGGQTTHVTVNLAGAENVSVYQRTQIVKAVQEGIRRGKTY